MYAVERVPESAKAKPALKNVEPFKPMLSGNRGVMATLTLPELEKIYSPRFSPWPRRVLFDAYRPALYVRETCRDHEQKNEK